MRLPAYRCTCGKLVRDGAALRMHVASDHGDEIDTGWRIRGAITTPVYIERCLSCDVDFETLAGYTEHVAQQHVTVLTEVMHRRRRNLVA